MAPEAGWPALQARLGYTFVRPALFAQALSHSTWANEQRPAGVSYERLEFLGDAVLQLLVSANLVASMPGASEGVLSRRRAELVREAHLANLARVMQLAPCIRMGGHVSPEAVPTSVLADVVEALLAAVYLDASQAAGPDAGLGVAQAVLMPWLAAAQKLGPGQGDAKTQLQELCHKQSLPQPVYTVTAVQGPAHARKYTVTLVVGTTPPTLAQATSIRAASQACAQAWITAWPDA